MTRNRLGDGFYEQRLVREQIGQLTGSGYLSGYADDEAQYRALLNNGATFAKEHQLVPGVALTAEQMSQLTSDLVWLVEQTVTLADGSTQRVLVPQVYLVPREGDLTPSGSLIAGGRVEMALSGDFNNGGSVRGGDVRVSAQNVSNTGEMRGTTLALSAREDLRNIGGALAATGDMSLAAGRDIVMETTTASGGMKVGNVTTKATVLDQVASLSAGGVMVMQAGRDVSLEAVKITQGGADGAGANGGVLISAGRDLTLSTVQTSSSRDEIKNANNYKKESVSQDNGTSIAAQGAISLKAGQDLVATAAEIKSTSGAVSLSAGRDVQLLAGEANQVIEQMTQKKKSGFLKKKVTTTYSKTDETVAVATTVSGNTVSVQANQDLLISGSNVVSDAGTTLLAGRDVTIDSVTNTLTSQNFSKTVKSGLMSGGGLGFTIGKQSLEQTNKKTELTSAGSTVASVQGDVTVVAGGAYKQVGSTVSAPAGDVSVLAKSIDIEEARNKSVQNSETKFKQSGLTVSISAPGVAAAMGAVSAAEHATQTEDDRMKALAAATAISKAMQAQKEISGFYDAIKADDAKKSISVSISVGSSKSTSQQVNQADQAAGSSVLAGGALSLVATGADKDSNVTVRGSSLAGQDVTIKADNAINLVAAANNSEQHSNNKSTSSSVGVGISLGQKREFGVTVSGSVSTGNSDGLNTSYTTTDVKGGNSVTLESGGNTALKGAVVTAPQVTAKVGGDLKVESLQDTATFDSKSTSVSGSVTFTGPVVTGANAAFSNSKVSADYAAVGTQAGIRAGDGGFNVVVAGNTDLKGGAITSSQAAIDAGKNSLTTGTLTSSDINNRSQYSASAVTVSVGTSGGMAGGYKDSGDERSTTKSTISAGATTITSGDASSQAALDKLDRGATNDATAGKLAQGWDGQKLGEQAKLNAQIVADFGAQASKNVAGMLDSKRDELRQQADEAAKAGDKAKAKELLAEAEKYDESGAYRIAAHAVIGGLGGGVGGALGAAGSAAAAKPLTSLQADMTQQLMNAGVSKDTAIGLAQLTIGGAAATLGGAVGSLGGSGINGAAAGLNEDFNNRALHLDQLNRIKTIARGNAEKEQQLAAVLCVLQECSIDGIKGVTASSNYGLQKQGEELKKTNPELFDRLAAYIKNDSQLLTGDNAYDWTDKAADSIGERVAKAQFANAVVGAVSKKITDSVVPKKMTDVVVTVANELSDSLMDFVNIGKSVARNGPYSVSPLDMPASDDGRPPTAGGGTAVVTPPVVVICPSGLACLVPPVGGVVPSNVVLSTSGGGSNGDRGNGKPDSVLPDADLIRTPPSKEEIAELIAEHSKQVKSSVNASPLTQDGAKSILNEINPPGTTAKVMGDNAAGPDIKIINSSSGEPLTTVQVKSVAGPRGFEFQVKRDLSKELGPTGGSEVIAVQVPVGSNPAQLSGKLGNFEAERVNGRSIVVVDSAGNVLIPLQPMINFVKAKP